MYIHTGERSDIRANISSMTLSAKATDTGPDRWGSALSWGLTVYLFAGITIAVTAGYRAGIGAGLAAAGSGALALFGGAGLRSSLTGDRAQKFAGLLIGLALLAAAGWLGRWYSVRIFDVHLTGWAWALIGFVTGLVFTPRSMAQGPWSRQQ
jgi:hypothetical protein